MSVIYRVTDRFDIKVDSLTVTMSPLDYKVKADMQASVISGKPMDAAVLALRHSIKDIKGLQLPDGSNYQLEFEGDAIKEECISDLMNIPESGKLNVIAIGLINGMPDGEFLDPETGGQLDGVKFVDKVKVPRKKKTPRR